MINLWIVLFLSLTATVIANLGCGEDNTWHPFKDEKCYKTIDRLVNRDEAANICLTESATLGSSKTPEEQAFLTQLVFDQLGVIDNVWLGSRRLNTTHFQWDDGDSLAYTNWAIGSPSNDTNKACLQMQSHLSKSAKAEDDGLWSDVSCLRRNVVLCQKLQSVSLSELYKMLVEHRKEIDEFKSNPVPVGFVYVELPNRPDPQMLWPSVMWQEVTSNYAGLFFRAAGGSSAAIGEVQLDNTPKIDKIKTNTNHEDPTWEISLNYPGISDNLFSTFYTGTGSDKYYHTFHTSGGEVRPINTAVRIWIRIQ